MDRCGWQRVGFAAAGVALCVGLAVGIGGPRGAAAQPERVTERAPVDEAQAAEDLRYARSLSRAFQHAAEHVEPSVVHITTRSDQLVRDFFGRVRERSSSGLGSGVIVSEDGYILTNNHVIKGAGEVLVKLADGRTVPGKVIGGDELRDIAVVRIEATGLTAARLGSDEPLEVGEWVLAVGSPFGFDQTVTAGIVSAMGRGLGIVSDEFKDAEQFIQTDAAINPGNSGGPLINLDGEVVGINSAIFSRTGGSVGLGFSIPIDLARAVYDNIIRGGRSDFGWLGVELGTGDGGVRVARVLDDSPAASAGLLVGDVIRRYQGREVADSTQLIRSIQFTPPGSEARFEVERSGRPFELTARVASRTQAEFDRYDGRRVESLGLTVITASEEALGTGTGTDPIGAFVVEVEEGSVAARAGLQRGDLIIQIGGESVRSAPETVSRLTSGGREVRIDIRRGEMRGYTTLRR
jgi:serine protease Do